MVKKSGHRVSVAIAVIAFFLAINCYFITRKNAAVQQSVSALHDTGFLYNRVLAPEKIERVSAAHLATSLELTQKRERALSEQLSVTPPISEGRAETVSHENLGMPWHKWGLRSSRDTQPVEYLEMPEPVLVIFGNAGYRDLLANFICNTRVFPTMQNHTLLLTNDEDTRIWIEEFLNRSIAGSVTTGVIPNSELQGTYNWNAEHFKKLMFERGQALMSLIGHKNIVWLEADAMYYQDLTKQSEMTDDMDGNDLTLYWDGNEHGGGFIRFAPTPRAKQFYSKVLEHMQATGLDDQQAMKMGLKDLDPKFKVFDTCRYRSGRIFLDTSYEKQCKDIRPVVQQWNWVVGTEAKINLAKAKGGWFLHQGQCQQRDLRLNVMTMNRAHSVARLLNSLKNPEPSGTGTELYDLQVTVDVRNGQDSADPETIKVLKEFVWPHGFFEWHAWSHNVGIIGQWVHTFPCELYHRELYKAFVLFEDDVEASPLYARWYLGAHRAYANPRIGAITGMRPQLVAAPQHLNENDVAKIVPQRGIKAFAYKLPATWGMSPTWEVWAGFRKWFHQRRNEDGFQPFIEGIIPNNWYKGFLASGTQDGMWEMWFLRYAEEHNLFTVYPWADGGTTGFIIGWKEAGLHYDGSSPTPDFPPTRLWDEGYLKQFPLPYADWGLRSDWGSSPA